MNLLAKGLTWAAKKLGGRSLQLTFMPGQILWPDDNKNAYIQYGYNELPNVYAIISLIVQKSKIVPFKVYQVKNQTKYREYKAMLKAANTPHDYAAAMLTRVKALDLVENSELEKLLNSPNKYQSIEDLNEEADGYKLLTGNAFWWGWEPGSGRNAAKPVQLHSVPSTMVSAITGDLENPVKAWKFEYLKEEIPASQVGHFKTWKPLTNALNPSDAVYGQSPLMSCRRLLAKYKAADIAQGTFFKNMGPAGMLTGDGPQDIEFGEEEAGALKDKYRSLYQGTQAANDVLITAAKLKWTQIGSSAVDLNIIEGKEEILGELCNVYHVPIGMFTKVNSTENNMVESRKMMITDAVIPLVEDRKNVLNRWLAPKFGQGRVIEYDYNVFSEIREELESLVNTATKMRWISENEKRELTGYDKHPDPLMDKIYLPSNLVPIDQLNMDPFNIDPNTLPELDDELEDQDEVTVDESNMEDGKVYRKPLRKNVDLTKNPAYNPNAKPGEIGYLNPKDGTLIVDIIEE